MLDVIFTRNLPLDRITTTDVWATDTISANLPPMEEFKARMDERIWNLYRVDVEHLCARNKDGSKKTYEQMFYHVPVRKSGGVQTRNDPRLPGSVESVVSIYAQAEFQATECRGPLPDSHPTPDTTTARNSRLPENHIKGFPLATGVTWCQKLKLRVPPLHGAPHEAREKKYRGILRDRGGRACPVWSVKRMETGTLGRVRHLRGFMRSLLPVRQMSGTDLRNILPGWLLVLPQPRCGLPAKSMAQLSGSLGAAPQVGQRQSGDI